jgi:ABC-type Fe3+/spermidine/putrescine transport system ATPase subunit
MQIELWRLQKTLGITTIFVTHDQQEALGMADRVAVMHDGRIEQFDTPARIYNAPATPFVADFIGQTNRIGGTVRSMTGDRMHLQLDGRDRSIEVKAIPGVVSGDRVVAMVRPECVYMGSDAAAPASLDISLPGKIADVLFVGEKISVYVQTMAGTIAASLLNPTRRGNGAMVAGTDVTVGWRTDDLMIFRHA